MKIKAVQIILLQLLLSISLNAQLVVKINGKEIKSGEEILLTDAKTMEMSFKKAKKIPEYTSGRSSVYMKIMSENDELIALYEYTVDGYKASNNFLYPTSTIFYTIWTENNVMADMKLTGGKGIANFKQNLSRSVDYRRLKVSTHLTFEESISYDKYGKVQVLLEPLTFYLEVWSKNNQLSMPEIGATYTYPGSGAYKNMKYHNPAESIYGNAKRLTDESRYTITTVSGNDFQIQTISITGSQDNEISSIKTNFEGYLRYIANSCNGKKILKNIPTPDNTINWDHFSGYNSGIVFADLDQQNNPNYTSVKLLEPTTVGTLTGFKFVGTQKTYKCSTKDAFITTIEGPADPAKQEYRSTFIFYLLKHPTMSNKLIAITYKWVDKNSNDMTETNNNTSMIEEFLSDLTF